MIGTYIGKPIIAGTINLNTKDTEFRDSYYNSAPVSAGIIRKPIDNNGQNFIGIANAKIFSLVNKSSFLD